MMLKSKYLLKRRKRNHGYLSLLSCIFLRENFREAYNSRGNRAKKKNNKGGKKEEVERVEWGICSGVRVDNS